MNIDLYLIKFTTYLIRFKKEIFMSMIDVHLALGHAIYLEKSVAELLEITNMKRKLLDEVKARSGNEDKLSKKEKKLFDDLVQKEDEIIADLIDYKKKYDLPPNALKIFAEETGIKPEKEISKKR